MKTYPFYDEISQLKVCIDCGHEQSHHRQERDECLVGSEAEISPAHSCGCRRFRTGPDNGEPCNCYECSIFHVKKKLTKPQ